MNRLRYNITLLLMLMAYSAAAQAPIQHPFIVSYWVKAQNDTVSTVQFSDYDPSLLKLIRRQPAAEPQLTTSWQLTRQQVLPPGSTASPAMTQLNNADGEAYTVKNNQVTELQFATQVKGSYQADDGSTHDINIASATTARATIKAGLVNWPGEADAMNSMTALQPIVSVTGYDPQTVHVRQQFLIGPQTVTFEWSYEDYGLVKTDKGIVALPFLQPDIPELVSIDAQETEVSQQAARRLAPINIKASQLPASANISNLQGESKTYNVTARFRQRFSMANQSDKQPFEKEFDIKYTVTLDNKLVDVTYEKDYEWTEAHDNLPVMTYYIVYRHRTYSTGETLTDTFICPYGWMVSIDTTISKRNTGPFSFVYHNNNLDEQDFRHIKTTSTGVPDINLLSYQVFKDTDEWDNRNLNDYTSALYNYHYDSENPQEGWYAKGIYRNRSVAILYDETHYNNEWVNIEKIGIEFYDRFLYIDGQVIDFSDYRMTYDFDFREQPTTLSDGTPAKVFTHECKAKYLGKDFYVTTVDTVYQIK